VVDDGWRNELRPVVEDNERLRAHVAALQATIAAHERAVEALRASEELLPWRLAPDTVVRLDVDAGGFVDLRDLESLLCAYNQDHQHGTRRVKLVAVSGASNVLGVCNDLGAIGQLAHRYGARLLVDAAQLVAHRRVDMEGLGIDYLAFSGHKVYAPFGCGVLVVRKGLLDEVHPGRCPRLPGSRGSAGRRRQP